MSSQKRNRTTSDHVAPAAQEADHEIISNGQIINFSPESQKIIAELILNPPPPAPAMLRARERHRKQVVE